MFRRRRDEPSTRETVCAAYLSTLSDQHAVLSQAIQDTFRTVDWLLREDGAEAGQAHHEARELLGADIHDRIVAAAADGDLAAVSDGVDHRIARLLASFHREVLYQHALQTACRRHGLTEPTGIWVDEDDQDALQGRLFCALREFATPGAWEYVIDSAVGDFGEHSPFVAQLQQARAEEGLPSLARP